MGKDIEIDFEEPEFAVRDLYEFQDLFDEAIIDGDKRKIIIKNAKDELIEELENRGIKYRVI